MPTPFLKLLVSGASTVAFLSLLHEFTTRFVTKLILCTVLSLVSWQSRSLRPPLVALMIGLAYRVTLSISALILFHWIKSPLSYLLSRVARPRLCNLSGLLRFFKNEVTRVALFLYLFKRLFICFRVRRPSWDCKLKMRSNICIVKCLS